MRFNTPTIIKKVHFLGLVSDGGVHSILPFTWADRCYPEYGLKDVSFMPSQMDAM
jgi:bisphosphoglycerate-independent phosphoglycerate mutase (AlkP superfamily)